MFTAAWKTEAPGNQRSGLEDFEKFSGATQSINLMWGKKKKKVHRKNESQYVILSTIKPCDNKQHILPYTGIGIPNDA